MAKAGEKIHNPVQGDSMEFRQTARDTGGELMSAEMVVSPAAAILCMSIPSRRSTSWLSPAPSVCRSRTSTEG